MDIVSVAVLAGLLLRDTDVLSVTQSLEIIRAPFMHACELEE